MNSNKFVSNTNPNSNSLPFDKSIFQINKSSETELEGKSWEKIYLPKFLLISVKCCYCLCMSPFYLRRTKVNRSGKKLEEFVAASWWPQKILCAFLTLLDFTWIIRFIRLSIPTNAKNPAHHIGMVTTVISQIYKVVMFKKLWLNQGDLVKLVNFVSAPRNAKKVLEVPNKTLKRWGTHFVYILMFAYTGLGLGYAGWVTGNVQEHSRGQTGIQKWWMEIKEAGQYNFFIRGGVNRTNAAAVTSEDMSGAFYEFFGVLSLLGFLHRRIFGIYCDGILMMAVMTLWIPTKAFAQSLGVHETDDMTDGNSELKTKPEWNSIQDRFISLKKLSVLVNNIIGTIVILFLLETLLSYGSSIDDLVGQQIDPNWQIIISSCLYLFNCHCVVLFAADICHLARYLKDWLHVVENRVGAVDSDTLALILNDIDSNCVAIKGGNVFSITYSTVANILGVTLTYYIVCVQY